jgi:hypothetical protein
MTAVLVAFCSSQQALARCIAGSPARRRGNFLLRGQKKVTKEEALNRTPAPLARAAPCNSRTAAAHMRPAALSLLSLSPAPSLAPAARLTRGCTPCSRENPIQRRSGDAIRATPFVGWGERSEPQRHGTAGVAFAFADEPGVQPALTGVKVRSAVLVTGTAARAQRLASARNARGGFRAPLLAARDGLRFRASSLVTFFWPRRRKPKVSAKPKLPGRRDGLPAMQRAAALSAKATPAK